MQVFIIAAVSSDGFIAKDPKEPSTNWTSKADKLWFNKKTKEAGVVIMGRKTYETIDEKWRPLPDRLNIIYSKNFPKSDSSNLRFTSDSPKKLLTALSGEGYKQVAICGGSSIYTMFLNSGLVDKLFISVEENIKFGTGMLLFSDGTKLTEQKFKLISAKNLAKNTTLLEYDFLKTS